MTYFKAKAQEILDRAPEIYHYGKDDVDCVAQALEAEYARGVEDAAKRAEEVARHWDHTEGPSYCASADEAACFIRKLAPNLSHKSEKDDASSERVASGDKYAPKRFSVDVTIGEVRKGKPLSDDSEKEGGG